jgi:hypothetical protein
MITEQLVFKSNANSIITVSVGMEWRVAIEQSAVKLHSVSGIHAA